MTIKNKTWQAALWILLYLWILPMDQAAQGNDSVLMHRYEEIVNADWNLAMDDPMTSNWQEYWFLEGKKAGITHDSGGMDFWAGPVAGEDASHAVLWTKQSFSGNLKITYEYTRLDSARRYVNIIYLQSTGIGIPPYESDIAVWKDLREVPAMHKYYKHMNTYHISYAAFGTENNRPDEDYVRARRYMPALGRLKGTEIPVHYERTGMFKTGLPHKITIIKVSGEIFMHVSNQEKSALFHWKNDSLPPVLEGRVGLRHMYTRGARYSDFRIYTSDTEGLKD